MSSLDKILPQIFQLVAEFSQVSDLVSLAYTSKTLHRDVIRLSWDCTGEDCTNKIFQGEGIPMGCSDCKELLCPECADKCEKCDKIKCYRCSMHYCEHCDKLNCFDCTFPGFPCSSCDEWYCEDCEGHIYMFVMNVKRHTATRARLGTFTKNAGEVPVGNATFDLTIRCIVAAIATGAVVNDAVTFTAVDISFVTSECAKRAGFHFDGGTYSGRCEGKIWEMQMNEDY